MSANNYSWKGYGSPSHPLTPINRKSVFCVARNYVGYATHERHATFAESRLERQGVLPELLAYVAEIGRTHGR